ncbi:MAG: hypothetical protein CM15mP98_06460 [Paracoccaceae bacterium]|nr:MAG: hypothetical protein CM15mP98_06460 [Paracoccaceae bacterium]
MKRILFVNPSLRLHSETKFLPVGIASVMSYLNSLNVEFDFLDIDINDLVTLKLKSILKITDMM